ncbi:MAG: asparagine synthase (glutamine-hydrolyzing) [bacterium]|nr:asparagine synthase (glutamine-hydrolyzing) [bacterium]
MCGISGFVNIKGSADISSCISMIQATLSARGPDESGSYTSEHATLIHTRLAVIDVENGKQPMSYNDQGMIYTIVYNGELYNTQEIKDELKKSNETFATKSDTEVVLKAYIKWGRMCVNKFNGIFAFAIWCDQTQTLFFARDRIGVKPLFFSLANNGFAFASEIKALLNMPFIKPIADTTSICELFLIGPGRTPGKTAFCNISEIKPGHCGFFDKNGLTQFCYWTVKDKPHTDSFEQTCEKVRYLVTDSIKRQLVSDVPIGTFLSGGLDSSLISSVASRHFKERGKKLKTFSISYKDNDIYFKKSKFQPNSDDSYINIMADYLDSDHTTFYVDTPQLTSALYAAVDARDLPGMADVDASLLLFCKEIKKHVTVALSGECADEIFGGYPWYRDSEIRSRYGFPWSQSTLYRSDFLREDLKKKINAESYVNEKYNRSIYQASKLECLSPLEQRMREMVYLNMYWFMQTLLDRKDRMSMYSGLEVRVPFCDHRIAEYLYSTPWEFKDYKHYEKGLLRNAMKDYLPDEILWRKKSPYPKTHNPSYLAAVSEILIRILNNPKSRILEVINKEKCFQLLSDDRQQPWYGQLMTTPQTIAYLIQLDYWLEKYNVELKL